MGVGVGVWVLGWDGCMYRDVWYGWVRVMVMVGWVGTVWNL